MAATWNIVALDRQLTLDDKADVVTAVHWQIVDSEIVGSGDDELRHTGQAIGVIGLDTSDLSSFTAYADVTEENAIAWAKAAMGDEQVAQYEQSVADQISESKTPTKGTGVPWND
tara:strand:- start:6567 stop:6911 length:345 start_codon:yes stop_codon:yes gene_type:complete